MYQMFVLLLICGMLYCTPFTNFCTIFASTF